MIHEPQKYLSLYFANDPHTKQIKQLIRLLKYAYSYSLTHHSKTTIYICNLYISIANDSQNFRPNSLSNLCTLSNKYFSSSLSLNPYADSSEESGYLFQIDIDTIFKFLFRLESLHLTLRMPLPSTEHDNVSEMEIISRGQQDTCADMKLPTKLIDYEGRWGFPHGSIDQESWMMKDGHDLMELIRIAPCTIKNLRYAKKHNDILLHLKSQGIYLQTVSVQNRNIISEHQLILFEHSSQYATIADFLSWKNYIVIKSDQFFHHLQYASQSQVHCILKIAHLNKFSQKSIKAYYMVMLTSAQPVSVVSEIFQVYPIQQFKQNLNEIQIKSLDCLIDRTDTIEYENKLIQNRYYNRTERELMDWELSLYEREVSCCSKSQETNSETQKKHKIRLD